MNDLEEFLSQSDVEYVSFGDMARELLNMQAQYAAYFLNGAGGLARIADDLRVKGQVGDYHSLQIHRDDVAVFVSRAKESLAGWGVK